MFGDGSFSVGVVRIPHPVDSGLFVQALMKAQNASPTFTHVYAALVSVLNTKFPQLGDLLLRRLVIQFRRSYKQNRKVRHDSLST